MARLRTRCAIATSDRPRPAIPVIWGSSCVICPTCRRYCAPSLALRTSIERWWQQLEAAKKYPEGSGKVINALAMAASCDPDPTHFLGIRLPVTLDTCELLGELVAARSRDCDDTHSDNLRRLEALYVDCGEKDQFNLLYGARRFVRRLNELDIAHRYEEFPDNHTGVDYRMDESLPFLAGALSD